MGRRRPVGEPTNEDRCERIDSMLERYSEYSRHDRESSMIDLLTDLRHWFHRDGLDFEETVRISEDHFQTEIREAAERSTA